MAGPAARWASFDCYGTLIDWNAGIGGELARVFGPDDVPRLLHRYHELEPVLEAERPARNYREVLDAALAALADEEGVDLSPAETTTLSRSLPEWPAFPEVRVALERARASGWRLAMLSNTDPDYIAASIGRLGIEFDLTVAASEIGSYKPGHAHWQAFAERSGADPSRHVHVAASLFHDVAPANELGIPVVWINRLGERPEPQPTRELPDLAPLPEVLDELVPA